MLLLNVLNSFWGLHTRVAAEGQFPSGCVGLRHMEVPVFVDPHGGGVRVPAGMGKQEVLITRQHLRKRRKNRKVDLAFRSQTYIFIYQEEIFEFLD